MSSAHPSGKVTGFGGGNVVTTAEKIDEKFVNCESSKRSVQTLYLCRVKS